MSIDIEPSDNATQGMVSLLERIEKLEAQVTSLQEDQSSQQKLTIVASKGTLDMAFPPLNLASTAAAFDYDVSVFHTFWGLDVLHEEHSKNLPMSSVGNPNVPMPNLLGVLPGMDEMTARMMKRKMKDNGNAMIEDLVHLCLDHEVDLLACGTTIDLMGYDGDDFYDGVTVGVGAPTAFQEMATADIQLFI